MTLALFDLDNTILDGDSEWIWSEFLYHQGIVGKDFCIQIENYYRDYQNNRLDFHAYQAFLLHPLTLHPQEKLLELRGNYLSLIQAIIRPKLIERLSWHRRHSHELLLITATNNFLAEPIAALLNFSNLICTQIEIQNGKFTGKLSGVPAFREGKVKKINRWLDVNKQTLVESWGYSDSFNDLPLLDCVEHPVAVTPDPILRQHALYRGWYIMEN
jgi:HAD superfamily hydrolase (TIGR01490 family)